MRCTSPRYDLSTTNARLRSAHAAAEGGRVGKVGNELNYFVVVVAVIVVAVIELQTPSRLFLSRSNLKLESNFFKNFRQKIDVKAKESYLALRSPQSLVTFEARKSKWSNSRSKEGCRIESRDDVRPRWLYMSTLATTKALTTTLKSTILTFFDTTLPSLPRRCSRRSGQERGEGEERQVA